MKIRYKETNKYGEIFEIEMNGFFIFGQFDFLNKEKSQLREKIYNSKNRFIYRKYIFLSEVLNDENRKLCDKKTENKDIITS